MNSSSIELGINIDHVATVRQARRVAYPDPVHAALLAEQAGADNITLHLREDRRHIQDRDVHALRPLLQTRMNLEMGLTHEMIEIAVAVRPQDCCLVPENRAEVTTEGGLDVAADIERVAGGVRQLAAAGIRVALFIAPDLAQIDAAKRSGAQVIELHTGTYAEASGSAQARELERLSTAAKRAANLGLEVHAGHGLTYNNVAPVAAIPEIVELNIGHCIIARAIFTGLPAAVRDMKALMIGGAAMIFGIGVDVLEAARIKKTLARFGDHFIDRLLMPAERAQLARTKRPERFIAMRFAAKEAIVKAMGTGFAHGMWIRDVGVVQNAWGKPEVAYSPRGEKMRRKLGIGDGHVTLTDEAGLIVAVAVLEAAPKVRKKKPPRTVKRLAKRLAQRPAKARRR